VLRYSRLLTDAVVASGPQEQVDAALGAQLEAGLYGQDVLALVVLQLELERHVGLAEPSRLVQSADGHVQHGPDFGQRDDVQLGIGGQQDGRADHQRSVRRLRATLGGGGGGGPRRRGRNERRDQQRRQRPEDAGRDGRPAGHDRGRTFVSVRVRELPRVPAPRARPKDNAAVFYRTKYEYTIHNNKNYDVGAHYLLLVLLRVFVRTTRNSNPDARIHGVRRCTAYSVRLRGPRKRRFAGRKARENRRR